MELHDNAIECPYCGEQIDVLVDDSVPEQSYIEDCQVCCRPINFFVTIAPDGGINIVVTHEND